MRAVVLAMLLLAGALTVPTVLGLAPAPAPARSAGLSLAFTPASGGAAYPALVAVYNSRPDLQAAFPNATSNVSDFMPLVNWAGGVVTGQWADGSYSSLAPFGYYYALMMTYNERSDLRSAFPHAYMNMTSFAALVSWAGHLLTSTSNDGAYSTLAPFGYYYALLTVYAGRSDLQAAFPSAYTNTSSFANLVGWAAGVAEGQWSDGAYGTLAPFGSYYALMSVYSSRADLQAAFPGAFTTFSSFTGLVNWAGCVVESSCHDGASTVLSPFGSYYALMRTYDGRADLQAAEPDAFTDWSSYTHLVNWAGGVVTGSISDGSFLSLQPFGYFYDLMMVYDSRANVQTVYPNAYTDWASFNSVDQWAGEVVNGTIPLDPSEPALQTYGYFYVLFGWVYSQRPDLQSAYPTPITDATTNHGLLQWADEVVSLVIIDPDYLTLLPFAPTYEALG